MFDQLKDRPQRKKHDTSAQELYHDKLPGSEERFKLFYMNSPVPYQSLDVNGCILEVNPAWLDLLGYQKTNVLGRSFRDFLTPEYQSVFDQRFPLFKEVGVIRRGDLKIVTQDGRCLHIEIDGNVQYNSDKSFKQTHCVLYDVTDRKRIEQSLRESEQRLKRAQQIAKMGDFSWDVDTGQVIWSDSMYEMLGYDPLEDIDYELVNRQIHHPDDLPHITTWLQQAVQSGHDELPANEYRIFKKNGEMIYVRTVGVIERPQGESVKVFATMQDITERKKVEHDLHESEKKYRSLFENIMNGFALHELVTDENDQAVDYIFLEVNDAFERLTTLKRNEIIGKRVTEVLPGIEHDQARWIQRYGEVVRTGQEIRFEQYAETLNQWFSVLAFKYGDNRFATIFEDITERKLAEVELENDRQQLAKAQEIGKIGTWQLDLAKNGLGWTKENYHIFEIPENTPLSYETFLECVHPDDRDYVHTEWAAALNGKPYDIEHRIITNGKTKWVREKAEITNDSNGCPLWAIGVTQDITKHKKIAEELEQSQERLKFIFQSVPVGICHLKKRIFRQVNPAFCKLLGYTPEELMGKDTRLLYRTEEEFQHWGKILYSQINKQGEVEMEVPFLHKQGRIILTLCRGVLVNPNDPEEGHLFSFYDITVRKQAELALLESQTNLREAQRMAELGFWQWDIKSGEVEWSDQVYKIFRLNPDEFTPQIDSIMALSPWPEDHQRHEELVRKAIESREAGEYEQRFYRPDGSIGYYHSTFQGIYDDTGGLIAIKGTVQDITQQKNAERERERLLQKLEAKNEELQSIVYVSSHDLKTPLVNINGFGKYLADHCKEMHHILDTHIESFDEPTRKRIEILLNEDIPEDLEFIQQSARKMQSLIDGLLQISRVGTVVLNSVPLDMDTIMKNVIDGVMYTSQQIDATFDVEPLGPCFGDPEQISQIFSNLIDNALKYAHPDRSPHIHISSTAQENQTVYSIEDNGIGIHPDYQDKIFEIFHRLDPNASTDGEGLGLSIVQRILSRHNGKIWVESQPDEGSQFYVSIPNREAS